MELQGRNLSINMRGKDVKLLQEELRQLGFSIEDKEGLFGKTTRQAVLEFQKQHDLETSGVVDEATANAEVNALQPEPEPFIVRGQIRKVDGSPLAEWRVKALDRDLRSRQELGGKKTDAEGHFEIPYTAEDFARAEKGSADLTFQIENQDGLPLETFKLFRLQNDKMVPVEAPQIIFNARTDETVEIVIGEGEYRGPSEYEELIKELTPVMQGVPPHELTEQDIAFLAGDTGIDSQRIRWLAEAAKVSRETLGPSLTDRPAIGTHLDAGSSTTPSIPPEVFYGLFRQNLPTHPAALLSQDIDVLRRALETSSRENVIPLIPDGHMDEIIAELLKLKAQIVLKPARENERASLGDLLATMPQPLERNQQTVVAGVLGEVRVDDEQFAKRLQAGGLSREQVVGVQLTLRLADMTLQHVPLVRALQELANQNEDASLRSLAALRQDQWLDLAYAHGAPGGSNLTEDAYARQLETKIEELHPTAVLASRLSDGVLLIEQPGFAEVGAFLKNNPTFDILATNIETFPAEACLDGIEHKDEVLTALKQLQRVKVLSATWQESAVLLNVGVESALHVVELGRDRLEDVVEQNFCIFY